MLVVQVPIRNVNICFPIVVRTIPISFTFIYKNITVPFNVPSLPTFKTFRAIDIVCFIIGLTFSFAEI